MSTPIKTEQPSLPGFTLMSAQKTLQKLLNKSNIESYLKKMTPTGEDIPNSVWQICQTNFCLINPGNKGNGKCVVESEREVVFAYLPAVETNLYSDVLVFQIELIQSMEIATIFADSPEHLAIYKTAPYSYITAFLLENKHPPETTKPEDIAQKIMSYCLQNITGDSDASWRKIRNNKKGNYPHSLSFAATAGNKSEAALKLLTIAIKALFVLKKRPLLKAGNRFIEHFQRLGAYKQVSEINMIINMRAFVVLKSSMITEFEREFRRFWRSITLLEDITRNDPLIMADSFSFSSFSSSVNQNYKYGQVLLSGHDLVRNDDGESNTEAVLEKHPVLAERIKSLETRLMTAKQNKPSKESNKIQVPEETVNYNTTTLDPKTCFIPLKQSRFKLEVIDTKSLGVGEMPEVEFRYANLFHEFNLDENILGVFIDTSVVANKTLTVVSTIAKLNTSNDDSRYRYVTFLYATSPRRKDKDGVELYTSSKKIYSALLKQSKTMFQTVQVVIADFDPTIRSAARENGLKFWGCWAHFKRIVAVRASKKTLRGDGASQNVIAFVKNLPFSQRQNDLIKEWISENRINTVDKMFLDKIKSHYFNAENLYFEFDSFDNIDKTVLPFYLTNNVSERVFSFLKKKKYPSCLEGILYHINYQLTTPNLVGVKNGIKNPSKLAYVLKRA